MKMPSFENSNLYNFREVQKASMAPIRAAANLNKSWFENPFNPVTYTDFGKSMVAASALVERMTRNYTKPEFGIKSIEIKGKKHKVIQETAMEKPFANLLKFTLKDRKKAPKILLIAPMSGHYATLLRGTVEAMVEHADIWVTDWENAREVPMYDGEFHFDTYVSYLIDFISHINDNVHIMAVCQPSVQAVTVSTLMNANKHPLTPKSMTLMGGPVDTRKSPTKVNKLSHDKTLSWFETNVITRVPFNYPGFMRRVYPGFLQLTGFMTMNLERHIGAHVDLFKHLIIGDDDSVESHEKFYDEYLSVADIPADFYLETIDRVFQRHLLPKGELVCLGQKVDAAAIENTAVLAIEGELDDISGVGQTKATLDICKNLAKDKKHYHLQKNVGHYGIFNGRKFRNFIVPVIVDFIKKYD